jgi:hypothetical protein
MLQYKYLSLALSLSLASMSCSFLVVTLSSSRFLSASACFSRCFRPEISSLKNCVFCIFGGLECVGHAFAYVAHFVFFGAVWNRTKRAAVANRRATNIATHLS